MHIRKLSLSISSCLLAFLVLLSASYASAHVVVKDSKGKASAILHITPGDDPIAGKRSELYYDIDVDSGKFQQVTLGIRNQIGSINDVLVASVDNHKISSSYIFSTKELYYLSLTVVTTSGESLTFSNSIRIIRSIHSNEASPQTPIWATVGCVVSAWGILLIGIVSYQRKKEIAKLSRF